MQYMRNYDSPIGILTMVSDGTALTHLFLDSQKGDGPADLPVFRQTERWLNLYFNGEIPDLLPAIMLSGTPFQQSVWAILQTIPYGKTITYGEIAGMLARERGIARMSAQAVGGAVGRNPIPILVPCHRVIGANGSLTGYSGGIERKIALLTLEKVDMQHLFAHRSQESADGKYRP